MYVVTVTFVIDPRKLDDFRRAVLVQASRSLCCEKSCRRFDVCQSPEEPNDWFLYEIYDDETSFLAHLETEHFRQFDREVTPCVRCKTVRMWQLEKGPFTAAGKSCVFR